jgi:putative transposase
MCHLLKVSRSGYYEWVCRPVSKRFQEDKELLVKIKAIHKSSRKIYGLLKIHQELLSSGCKVNKKRVFRLMRTNDIRSIRKKKTRATTNSKHNMPVASNLLKRNFTVVAPNKVWVSDITYVPTNEGWLYLATVMDLFSRRIVGWSMDSHMKTELVADALKMAISMRHPRAELIHHSDRGCQYASNDYQELLKQNNMICSMSRKGDCWDNAVMESFYSNLKSEVLHHNIYKNRKEAKKDIFDYIEVFYNRQRLHSTLGYKTPVGFEALAQAA